MAVTKSLGKALGAAGEEIKMKLAPTAIALGLISTPEEAEAAYIPLKAFSEGSEAAKALFEKAMKRIDEGADTRPNGELYNEMGVYMSEDNVLKVDLAELRARDVERAQGVQEFSEDLDYYLKSDKKRTKSFTYPITRYLPEDSPVFENFPELAEADVIIAPRSINRKSSYYNQGFYQSAGPWNNYKPQIVITVPTSNLKKGKDLSVMLTADDIAKQVEQSFNTLLHEFQHHIQEIKGASNTGFNMLHSKKALKGFRKEYEEALTALDQFQPGESSYARFKNKVDTVHNLIRDSFRDSKKAEEFMALPVEEQAKQVKGLLDDFEKGKDTTQNWNIGFEITLRELGESEARSTGLKGMLPEGPERRAIGVFYPTHRNQTNKVLLRPEDVPADFQIPNQQVLVRRFPFNEDPFRTAGDPLSFTQPQDVSLFDLEDAPAVAEAKKKKPQGGTGAAAVVGGGTAAGLASPPSEAFVEEVGERTGLFEDGSPTPSLFDVEGLPEELGITNTFLLDLLVPRTKPYDLISNVPVVGETMMAADMAQGLGSPEAEVPDEFSDIETRDVAGMRQGGGIETEAGKEMAKEKFQLDREKADLNKDGELSGYEKARGEAIQREMGEGKETKMAMGGSVMGMMADPFAPFQVTVDIDEHSGNEVPAGSKEEEVRDDIPAMLSEGEYVVPADVVRYHGLKTFEELRCEAKHALGLMAMHDRISYVDDDTKEPVEYDIKEKDLPEVKEAEVKVVKAAKGPLIDTMPALGVDTSFPAGTSYQIQYTTDPVTGKLRIQYIDPTTNQIVTESDFDTTRGTRFTGADVLGAEKETEEEEDEAPQCPVGQVYDEQQGRCVALSPELGGGDGDGPEGPSEAPEPSQGMSTADIDNALANAGIGYTVPTPTQVPGAVTALGVVTGIPVDAIARGIDAVKNTFNRNRALGQIRAGENLGVTPTGDYGSWRGNLGPQTAGAVAQTENEARGVASGDIDFGGSSFGSVAEADAVAESGWGSDAHFDAIEAGFDANTDQDGLGREGTDLGDAGDTSPNDGPSGGGRGGAGRDAGNSGPSAGDPGGGGTGSGQSPTGGDTEGTPFAKGGMPVRKNTPRKAMIKY